MTPIMYFALLLTVLAVAFVLLQWGMHYQAKRNEGGRAPDTSDLGLSHDYPLQVYYFYSQTCGPCRKVRPIVDKLQEQYPNLIGVDIAEHTQLACDFGITGVPSFIVVEDGIIKVVKLGRVSESWLLEWLD